MYLAHSKSAELEGFESVIARAARYIEKGARAVIVHPSVHQSANLCKALLLKDFEANKELYRSIQAPIVFVDDALVGLYSSITLHPPSKAPMYGETTDDSSSPSDSSADEESPATPASQKRKRRGRHSISMPKWKEIVSQQTNGKSGGLLNMAVAEFHEFLPDNPHCTCRLRAGYLGHRVQVFVVRENISGK